MTRQYDASNTVDYRRAMKAHPQQTMFTRGWSLAADAFTSALRTIFFESRRQAVQRHLAELPDYMLRDIGIRRDQISAIAAGRLTRETSVSAGSDERPSPAGDTRKVSDAPNARDRLAA